MKKTIPILLMIAGILLVCNAVGLLFFINYNFGVVLTFFAGAACFAYGFWFETINRFTSRGILKWMKYSFFALCVLVLGTIVFLFCYGQADTVTYQEDALIILGAGVRGETVTLPLQYRLDQGLAYIQRNPNAIVVVSGSQGPQEDITEAEAMKRYLMAHGVPEERILKEEQSHSTYENFLYSKQLLDKTLPHPYQAAFVTNDFHIFRADRLADIVGIPSTHLHAKLQWYTAPLTYLREVAALVKLMVFHR